ncbi:MAG: GAF domain-containing protein [Bacteroidota bacterium]|nr:GAF domain-containing protein [Bacteroidota bacterium]
MTGKTTIFDRVHKNALFHSVEKSLIRSIFTALKELKFSNGSIIFEDEDEGNYLFLVLSGGVKISKRMKNGAEIVLGILHEGDFFGELDLIDRRQRSARASAIGDCLLARLGKREFDKLLKISPAFMLNLLHMITLRLRTNNLTYVLHQESNLITLHQRLEKIHKLVEASKIVNSSLDLDQLLDLIFQTAARTVSADRGTLYLVDEATKEIWSKVQKGASKIEIRLPMGTGIAGTVASEGKTINIPDAYKDPRFNPKIDQLTGYRTKSTLCMPMKNKADKIIGVFQLLNKTKEPFTKEDEEFIEAFSVHAAIAIENAKLAQQMIQSERLSAVGKMASTIIHDIKNPMNILRLSAQVIKKRTDDKETAKLTEEMINQIDRFVAMTQEILDFARGVSLLNIQTVNFNETIETFMYIVEKDLSRHKVKVIKNFNYSGKLKVDPDKLLRVFLNITGNAADAMPLGGTISIKTYQAHDQLAIDFVDKGCGMTEEVRTKIFDPFFTSGKKHGTGLGMAIVKKIVDDHKGKVEVESKVGKGTTIRIFLPL